MFPRDNVLRRSINKSLRSNHIRDKVKREFSHFHSNNHLEEEKKKKTIRIGKSNEMKTNVEL